MDYNRNTKEYRMLERQFPQEFVDRVAATRAPKTPSSTQSSQGGAGKFNSGSATGAWPHQVGVHRVVWNNGNGLEASALVAAGTASGLCRVEWVWGRWVRGKIPYGSVGAMRMEGASSSWEGDEDDSEG